MPIIRLGNKAAIDRGQVLDGNRVTTVTILDEDSLESRVRTITHDDGIWPRHSTAPPAWVESDDEELQDALAEHFGCPVGEPNDWSE